VTVYWKRIITVLSLLIVLVAVIVGGTILSPEPIRFSGPPAVNNDAEELKTVFAGDKSVSIASVDVKPPDGMEAMLENESLRMYIDKSTAEIAVLDKRSGQIWRSNPAGRDNDPLATPQIKSNLSSQIKLTYFVRNNQTKDYDSFSDSIQYKQFEIEQKDNGVTVTYHFGSNEKGIESIPQKISKARFEEKLLGKLDNPDDKDEVDARFKLNTETQVYERREIPKAALKRLIALFEKAGYTDEDLAADNQENGVEGGIEGGGAAKFTIPLHYSLEGESLVASIDTTKIEESKSNHVETIGLLGSFGAAEHTDQGYIFVPDGSGALINLNNGKLLSQPMIISVYGDDGTFTKAEKFVSTETNRMPVYGIKRGDTAFFAIIEDGEALAKINADISGRLHQYNTVGTVFTVMAKDSIKMNATDEMIRTPNQIHQGKLQIRYGFLNGNQANYSGMAAYYRNYLEQKYGLKKQQPQGDSPFYIEMLGSMSKPDSFLGIPYDSQEPLTSFRQANQILDEMNHMDIKNIKVSYNGWFNGGLEHRVPTRVKLESVLGTRNEWMALGDRLKQDGGGLYPDVSFLKVYRKTGFNPSNDAAQFLSRKITKIFKYDLATYRKDSYDFSHYLLSPNKLNGVVSDFLDDYRDYNPGALALHDLGDDINSDFTYGETVDRQQAKQIIAAETEHLYKETPDLMFNGGNAYLLPYASNLLNVPLDSNGYQITDESIPFYEMVLHGYVDYAGKPYNYADDQDISKQVLKSLETGSNVYFKWSYEDPGTIMRNEHKELYAAYYKVWFDEAMQAYKDVNNVLKRVRGQSIKEHKKLDEGVYQTTYENGLSVIVNYRNEPVTVNGVTIEAEHYDVKG